MRAGWNPARRNRHVGTKAHGHGADNRMTIPESRHALRCFFERLDTCVVVERRIADRALVFLVEPTRPGWFHPCTVDDVCRVLSHLPPEHLATVDLVVLRQPTRKQRVLSPAWGRAIFDFETDEHRGAAIVLEAQDDAPIAWSLSLAPDEVRELERLREDGHDVRRSKRGFEIVTTPDSLRNTLLYRSLLHEVGHHVDHAQGSEAQWEGRTPLSKEDFAHRYAAQALATLRRLGAAPFAQAIDAESMRRDGLAPDWFQPARSLNATEEPELSPPPPR
jgi:hypothetical protein